LLLDYWTARPQSLLDLCHLKQNAPPLPGRKGVRDLQALSRQAPILFRLSCVLWNAIPGDWKDPDGWVERALAQCRAQAWTVMVLHDLPTGAMRNLERFLDATVELGVRFQQDFAPDCVPILDGRIVQPIEGFLTARS
jgi:hypothetical protein